MIIPIQFYRISIPQPKHISNCLLWKHKFCKVCESVSVLPRSSFCPFFRFHTSVKAFDVGVSLYDKCHLISRSIHVAKNVRISFLLMAE